jgi:hypothetical protein
MMYHDTPTVSPTRRIFPASDDCQRRVHRKTAKVIESLGVGPSRKAFLAKSHEKARFADDCRAEGNAVIENPANQIRTKIERLLTAPSTA